MIYKSKTPIKQSLDYLASQMKNVDLQHPNPIETLCIDDIIYLQKYLESIKDKKIQQQVSRQNEMTRPKSRANDVYDPISRPVPIDWRTYKSSNEDEIVYEESKEPGSRGSIPTRNRKQSRQILGDQPNDQYYNPYEYGSRQNVVKPRINEVYTGPYDNDPYLLEYIGVPQNLHQQENPGKIRNIDIESSLMQKELTRLPGNRRLTETNYNRFNLLPFNPQDPNHIVWQDNMPRGGYSTRVDRTEY